MKKVKTYVSSNSSVEIRYTVAGEVKREIVRNEDATRRVADIMAYLDQMTVPLSREQAEEYNVAKRLLDGECLIKAVIAATEKSTGAENTSEPPIPCLGEAVTLYISDCKNRGLKDKTVSDSLAFLKKFEKAFTTFRGMHTMSSMRIRGFLTTFKDPKTFNNKLAIMNAFLEWSLRRDYVADGILVNLPLKKKVPAKDPVPFTAAEFRKLIRKAVSESKVDLVLILGLGGLAGIRMAEISRMKWGHITMASNVINLTSDITKTRKRRSINTTPSLINLLLWASAAAHGGKRRADRWVVPTANKNRELKALAGRAGVDWKPNGLRKGFVSYGCALRDAKDVAREAGHSVEVLETCYKGLVSEEEAKEWFGSFPLIDED